MSILMEVPEMFGAETLLMNRARNEAVFDKTVALVNNFKEYFMNYGEKINENPSPGNKAGGITTLKISPWAACRKADRLCRRCPLLWRQSPKERAEPLAGAGQ